MTSRTDGEERRDRYSSASSLQLSLPPSSLPTCHPPRRLPLLNWSCPSYLRPSFCSSLLFLTSFPPPLSLCNFPWPFCYYNLATVSPCFPRIFLAHISRSYLRIFPSCRFLNAAFVSSLPFPLYFASLSLLLISLNCSASSCSQRALCALLFYQFMFISLVLLSPGSPFESRADADKTSLGHYPLFIPTFRITSTELRSTWPALVTWYG